MYKAKMKNKRKKQKIKRSQNNSKSLAYLQNNKVIWMSRNSDSISLTKVKSFSSQFV